MTSYLSAVASLALQPVHLLASSYATATTAAADTAAESRRLLSASWSFLTRDRTAPVRALLSTPGLLLQLARDAHMHRCTALMAQLMVDMANIATQQEIRHIAKAVRRTRAHELRVIAARTGSKRRSSKLMSSLRSVPVSAFSRCLWHAARQCAILSCTLLCCC